MKRLLLLAVALMLIMAPAANAAWTIVQSQHAFIETRNSEMLVVKWACTSDASGTDTAFTIDVTGYYLYGIRTDPGNGGDAPGGVYTLDFEDDLNFHLLDLDGLSTSATEWNNGSATLSIFPAITNTPSAAIGTLGAANTTDVYFYFVK